MDSLIKRIKQRLSGRMDAPQGPRLAVAAFGKHPGWDDHMEDIGLETPALVAIKRILYVQGIGRNIDSGKWAELESRQSSIEFGHTFVWCREGEIIAGRLWPSRDGRGRTNYPMVICVHGWRVPLSWVYDTVGPRLAQLETECRASRSASEVRACLGACHKALLTALDTPDPMEQPPHAEADPMTRLLDSSEPGLDNEGLVRILYHLDREMSAGLISPAGRDGYEHSAHARVPVSSRQVAQASILWIRLLLRKYGPQAGVLVLTPQRESWLDIVVGEPAPAQLYCLRAPLAALPLTNTVPYKISREFIERVRQQTGASDAGAEV